MATAFSIFDILFTKFNKKNYDLYQGGVKILGYPFYFLRCKPSNSVMVGLGRVESDRFTLQIDSRLKN